MVNLSLQFVYACQYKMLLHNWVGGKNRSADAAEHALSDFQFIIKSWTKAAVEHNKIVPILEPNLMLETNNEEKVELKWTVNFLSYLNVNNMTDVKMILGTNTRQ